HKHVKADLLKFHGFPEKSEKGRQVAIAKLERWTVSGLRELAEILNLVHYGTKEVLVERIYTFLEKPELKESAKGKEAAKTKTTTPKKTPKTPHSSDSEAPATEKKKLGRKPRPKTVLEFYGTNADVAQAATAAVEAGEAETVEAKVVEMWEALEREARKEVEERFEEITSTKAKGAAKEKPAAKAKKEKAVAEESEAEPAAEEEKVPKKRGRPPKSGTAAFKPVPKKTKTETSPPVEQVPPHAEAEAEAVAAKAKVEVKPSVDGTPREPSDAEIVAQIKVILATDDLESLSNKKVRDQLEVHFGIPLTERKKYITEQINSILTM
ncbi:DEK C terminal domain-containing protein, partial [Blyttiomyces helicus]